jgi:hypothetical protein
MTSRSQAALATVQYRRSTISSGQRRLAGEGAEHDRAIDAFGDMAGERRLAGPGIAEQAKQLRARLFQPGGDGGEGALLLAGPDGHEGISDGGGAEHGGSGARGQGPRRGSAGQSLQVAVEASSEKI